MKLSVEHFIKALDMIAASAGQEAAIVAQFALDIAVTAQFNPDGIEPTQVEHLLHLRLARCRASQQTTSVAIH